MTSDGDDDDFFSQLKCLETPQKRSDILGSPSKLSPFPAPSRVLLIDDLDAKARELLAGLHERLQHLPQYASDMLRHLRQQPNCPDSVIISLLEEEVKTIELNETRVLNVAEILDVLSGPSASAESTVMEFLQQDF